MALSLQLVGWTLRECLYPSDKWLQNSNVLICRNHLISMLAPAGHQPTKTGAWTSRAFLEFWLVWNSQSLLKWLYSPRVSSISCSFSCIKNVCPTEAIFDWMSHEAQILQGSLETHVNHPAQGPLCRKRVYCEAAGSGMDKCNQFVHLVAFNLLKIVTVSAEQPIRGNKFHVLKKTEFCPMRPAALSRL